MIIAALEELDLPRWMPDETPTLSDSDGTLSLYTPEGERVWTSADGLSAYAAFAAELSARRCVQQTVFDVEGGDVEVSTVYLHGVNHEFFEGYPVLLFETMIFTTRRGEMDLDSWDYQWRYSTWRAARHGHEQVVAVVAAALQVTGRDKHEDREVSPVDP